MFRQPLCCWCLLWLLVARTDAQGTRRRGGGTGSQGAGGRAAGARGGGQWRRTLTAPRREISDRRLPHQPRSRVVRPRRRKSQPRAVSYRKKARLVEARSADAIWQVSAFIRPPKWMPFPQSRRQHSDLEPDTAYEAQFVMPTDGIRESRRMVRAPGLSPSPTRVAVFPRHPQHSGRSSLLRRADAPTTTKAE
jgi:hypothetical protein